MDGRFTFVNEMACRVTGFSQEELLNKTYIDLVHPIWQDQLLHFL
jgi:PAS domain S-box-containing protein